MSAFSSPSSTLYQKKASCVFCNQIDEFVCGNASDTVFLFKDASVWLLHLCKMSALQNRIPKRSIHYWGESMGILLLAWTAGSVWRSTWMPMQNNVVNQSFFALPTPLPPAPKKFIMVSWVHPGQMENLLFMSFTEKDNFCLTSWAVVISSYLQ